MFSNFHSFPNIWTRTRTLCENMLRKQVALVERFDESIRLLERLLPGFFDGVTDLYSEMGSSRVNTKKSLSGGARRQLLKEKRTSRIDKLTPRNRKLTLSLLRNNSSSSRQLPSDVYEFVMGKLYYEQALYDYVTVRFNKQVEACGL